MWLLRVRRDSRVLCHETLLCVFSQFFLYLDLPLWRLTGKYTTNILGYEPCVFHSIHFMDGAQETGFVSIYFYSLQTFCAGCRPVLLATRQWRPKWLSQRPWKSKSPAMIAGGAMAAVANRGLEWGMAVLLPGKAELVAFTPLFAKPWDSSVILSSVC